MTRHLAKGGQQDIALFLRDKTVRKRVRRQQRIRRKVAEALEHQARLKRYFGRGSVILGMLSGPDRPKQLKRRGHLHAQLPRSFAMTEQPESTLLTVRNLARHLNGHFGGSLFLEMTGVRQFDVGANALLDVLVDECQVVTRISGRAFRWQGTLPVNPAAARLLRALGVIRRLKIVNAYLSPEDGRQIRLYDKRCRHYVRAMHPNKAGKTSTVTTELARHLEACLATVGKGLTDTGRSNLCRYVSEILDNAEEHAGMLDWVIQGYLDVAAEVPTCEVAILNFGRSIAETFQQLDPASYPRQQVQPYLDQHRTRGLFQANWREEDLLTLIALQGNVSSKNESDSTTRGNGTVDLIEYFQRVHAECSGPGQGASMVLVSGSTAIHFDGTYQMSRPADGRRVIAFNAKNDLTLRPDSQYVRKLDGVSFPGTLIGIKFPLVGTRSRTDHHGGVA